MDTNHEGVLMTNLVNEREAAEVLGCSVGLLRKWRLFREGPTYCKLGKLVRYQQQELMEFAASRRVMGRETR
jgi:hypothetical protein